MDTGVLLGIIGIGLSVGALAVAVPPFTQMLWGRPKLIFEFTDFTGSDGKTLLFTVRNKPVKSAFLRGLGVRRDTAEINASINILKQGTNEIVLMQIPAVINDPVLRKFDLVALARPHLHAAFGVLDCRPEGPAVYDPRKEAYQFLAPGNYVALIQVFSGDQHYQQERMFRASTDPIQTNWL